MGKGSISLKGLDLQSRGVEKNMSLEKNILLTTFQRKLTYLWINPLTSIPLTTEVWKRKRLVQSTGDGDFTVLLTRTALAVPNQFLGIYFLSFTSCFDKAKNCLPPHFK